MKFPHPYELGLEAIASAILPLGRIWGHSWPYRERRRKNKSKRDIEKQTMALNLMPNNVVRIIMVPIFNRA